MTKPRQSGEARGAPDLWRCDPETSWKRYRGQGKRGKPKNSDLNRSDLDFALESLMKAEDLLDELAPRQERVREALAQLDLAARFLADVRKRSR